MDSTKYVGMDVHTEAISVAVRNSAVKAIMESILETKANTILEFIQGLRGNVHVMLQRATGRLVFKGDLEFAMDSFQNHAIPFFNLTLCFDASCL